MSCPACGTENPAGSRFCMKCGAAVTATGSVEARNAGTTATSYGYTAAVDLSQHAGIGARIGSLIIDSLVILAALIVALIAAVIVAVILRAIHLPTLGVLMASLVLLMYAVGAVVYYPYCWVTRAGQTLGMKAMHIKVVRTDGGAVTAGPAIMRTFAMYVIDSIVFGIPLGVLWCLWDAKKQCWHDKMADTVVVRA